MKRCRQGSVQPADPAQASAAFQAPVGVAERKMRSER